MQLSATIIGIEQRTPKVKTFVLEYDNQDFTYYPGQWVDIHLTIDDETHNCGYSITSVPSNGRSVEIAVKLAPDLALTSHLHNKSKIGDRVYTSKAQGAIYLNQTISGAYVFIAGGVGITPLYSMIQHIMATKPETPVILIYSITSEKEFLFKTEIRSMEARHRNFKCHVTLTRDPEHESNFHGRISQQLLQTINLPIHANYYLCGPPAMVDTVVQTLNEMKSELQITDKNIHYDKWWS